MTGFGGVPVDTGNEGTKPAAIIIRFDLDVDGEAAQAIMRQVTPLLPAGADAWIGIENYAVAVDDLLLGFGQPVRVVPTNQEDKMRGVQHDHRTRVNGCYRCEVSADEARRAAIQRHVEREIGAAIKETRPPGLVVSDD